MKNKRISLSFLGAIFLIAPLFLFSCKKKEPKVKVSPEKQKLIDRGRAVYMTNCIACHNPNPKLAGGVGPDVYGSSFELLRLRVLYLKYPEGYKPKRDTENMGEFPELEADIPALYEYLNDPNI